MERIFEVILGKTRIYKKDKLDCTFFLYVHSKPKVIKLWYCKFIVPVDTGITPKDVILIFHYDGYIKLRRI